MSTAPHRKVSLLPLRPALCISGCGGGGGANANADGAIWTDAKNVRRDGKIKDFRGHRMHFRAQKRARCIQSRCYINANILRGSYFFSFIGIVGKALMRASATDGTDVTMYKSE